MAAGIIGFGDHHGGAIENCAKMLQETLSSAEENKIDELAFQLIAELSAK